MNILTIAIVNAAVLGIVALGFAALFGFCGGAIAIGKSYNDRLQKHGLALVDDKIVSLAPPSDRVFAQPETRIQ